MQAASCIECSAAEVADQNINARTYVSLDTPRAIVLGAATIAAAILASKFVNPQSRYQISELQAGGVARLDTQSGEVVVCMLHQKSSGEQTLLLLPCDGTTQ